MFDDESTNHSTNGGREVARKHSLFASLKPVFWRAPLWFEAAFCVLWLGFSWLWGGATPLQLLLALGVAALGLRGAELAEHYGQHRWPHDERKQRYPTNIYYAAWLLLLFSGLIKAFLVQLFAEPRETFVGFGLIIAFLAWCYPMMWSLDRVFKPWAARSGDKFAPAIVFIFLCGGWFFVSMFGLLHFTGKLNA